MYHFELKPFRKTFTPAFDWDKEVERLFEGFSSAEATYSPACDVLDLEKAYLISVDVPGLRKEDLDIEMKDNHLHIRGERRFAATAENSKVVRTEKRYGKFSRVFTIPQNVKTDGIEARFENGVLELTLPKEEKAQSKKITISDWGKKDDLPSDVKN